MLKSSLRKRAALTSVFALVIAGGLAGTAWPPASPAMAQTGLFGGGSQAFSFADVVEKVQPAVVSVKVKSEEEEVAANNEDLPFFFKDLPPNHPLRRFFEEGPGKQQQGRGGSAPKPQRKYGMSQGSGFFISEDGYVVTNNHVVEKASEVQLATDNGKTVKARVIGTDPRTDLALLKVDGNDKYPYVKFASAVPRVGDWVVAIGNPFGLGGSVTAGIVSARGRDIGAGPYDDFLQIDAAVNRGNSGGPTFNLNGDVVGINTAIYSPSGGNVGIAFAVPAEVAMRVINELKDSGRVTRGWLGVQIQPITDEIAESIGLKEGRGALVVEAQSGSPATKAGVQAGDAILAVNGTKIADARDLSRRVAEIKPNSKVKLTIWRDQKEKEIEVTLGQLPDEPQKASTEEENAPSSAPSNLTDLGIEVEAASRVDGAGNEGVVITDISPSSPVAERLSTGDVILDVAGKKVDTPKDVSQALKDARDKSQKSVLMRIRSGKNTRYVAVPVK